MKYLLPFFIFFISAIGFSQNLDMQNGTFNRCTPDKFFDSGGEFGNYGNDENFAITICPQNAGESIILDFVVFQTQRNNDIMTIYDGADTSASSIGVYSGQSASSFPGTVSATSANTSGCLTITFTSNSTGSIEGWEANILCCQTITPTIDSTNPVATGNIIEISPGDIINFNGSATFSNDGTGAIYTWDFGNGDSLTGETVDYAYPFSGLYNVTLTVTDGNLATCSETTNIIQVEVKDNDECVGATPICSDLDDIPAATGPNNAEAGIHYGCLLSEPDPRWYFIQSGAIGGSLNFTLTQTTGQNGSGSGLDIDFIIWGPFSQPECGANNLNAGTQVDCSYSSSSIENINIPNAPPNAFYVLLITNYSQQNGFFNLTLDSSSTGTTNCDIICQVNLGEDQEICNGESYVINPNFNGTFNTFEWQRDGVTINGETNSVLTVTQPGTYTLIADGVDAVFGDPCQSQDEVVITISDNLPLSDLTLTECSSNTNTANFNLDNTIPDVLAPLNSADYTTTFHNNLTDAENGNAAISPSNSYDATNGDVVYVRVELNNTICYETSTITLNISPQPTINPVPDLELCDDLSNDGTEAFDLESQTLDILGGSQSTADYQVTYHTSFADADTDINPLTSLFTNVPNPQPIYVRVEEINAPNCYNVSTSALFNLIVTPNILPTFDPIASICQGDTLSPLPTTSNNGITGSWSPALDDTTTTTYTFTPDPNQCALSTNITIDVFDNPIPNTPSPLEACDDDNDGFALFDLSTKDAQIIGGQANMIVTYHDTPINADQGISPLPINYNNINPDTQFLHVRLENTLTNCYTTTILQLVVNPLPTIVTISPYELCDNDNPGDDEEAFDLTTKDNEITNGQANINVVYYANQADADLGINPLSSPYTNQTNPQTIIAVLTNTLTTCSSSTSFDLVVNPLPLAIDPTPLEVCDDGISDGFTAINLSQKDTEISGNDPNYTVSYHLTLVDAQNETNPLSNPYTNTSNPQTIFVRVEDIDTNCYSTTTLVLDVQEAPAANINPTPLYHCDPDNDGFGQFTLTDADNDITLGVLGLTVSYHETLSNAENNVDPIDTTVLYNNIDSYTQILWVRVESATIATDCPTVVELELIVEDTPQLIPLAPLEICDDNTADGIAQFDLTTKEPEILNGQDPTQYLVSYYETEANAILGNNSITNPNAYTNTNTPFNHILWVRVDDITTTNGCYKLITLELIVNPLPLLVQPDPLELCDINNPGDQHEAFTLEDANAQILNGQTGITLTYYETQSDADNTINPITSPYTNIINPQTIFVRAENDATHCVNTITLTLRVNPLPSPESNPEPIEVCDDDNDGRAVFDLEQRTVDIINGESGVLITYHETLEDAESGVNPLSSPYTNVTPNNQLIYVRSENTTTHCYRLTQTPLELIVLPSPEIPVTIDDYTLCDTNNDGNTTFNLTTKADEILNGQDPTQYTISYHISEGDATLGDNAISNPANYTNTSNPQTIYVRLESTINNCVNTGEFNLRVNLPPIAILPVPLEQCDDLNEVPSNQITTFDLTQKDDEITGGVNSWYIRYYELEADAQAQTNHIADPTQYTNTGNPQTLHIVVTDNDTGCVDFTSLTIRVLSNPTPTASEDLPELEQCDYNTPVDGTEFFDLTQNEALIINGELGLYPLSYYESFEDAVADTNAIADPANYSNNLDFITPELNQPIYVRLTYQSTSCFSIVHFNIRVNPLPDVIPVDDYILCDIPYNFDGFTSFDLTTKTPDVLGTQDPNIFMVNYYENLADAQAQTNAIANPEAYTNTSNPQQIFVSITNTSTSCFISTQSFNLEVDDGAEANVIANLVEDCDDNMETDGDPTNDSRPFDLTRINAEVLGAQDPQNFSVSYYLNADDADLGENPLPTPYENTSNPQTLFARVDNNTPEVINFNLNLTDLDPNTNPIDLNIDGIEDLIDITVTPVFVDVDGDGDNDVLASFIDTDGDIIVTQIDANEDNIPDFVDINGDGIIGAGDNQRDSSSCFDVESFTLQVNPLPNVSLDDSYILCLKTNGTEVLDNPLIIDTGLSELDYEFEWVSTDDLTTVLSTQSSFSPQSGGNYQVTVTNTVTGCDIPVLTEVLESQPPTSLDLNVTTAFADSHVIQATAMGNSLDGYQYNLDGGPWQDDGLFTNVSLGEHIITARDKTGCGYMSRPIHVIDYPLYFTPNGDGNHDTWNITDTQNQLSSVKIYIFDRFGKFIKQISPRGEGWDGTYNGKLMPTNDYWFTITYNEPNTNTPKEFKAHFTLKR